MEDIKKIIMFFVTIISFVCFIVMLYVIFNYFHEVHRVRSAYNSIPNPTVIYEHNLTMHDSNGNVLALCMGHSNTNKPSEARITGSSNANCNQIDRNILNNWKQYGTSGKADAKWFGSAIVFWAFSASMLGVFPFILFNGMPHKAAGFTMTSIISVIISCAIMLFMGYNDYKRQNSMNSSWYYKGPSYSINGRSIPYVADESTGKVYLWSEAGLHDAYTQPSLMKESSKK